MTVSAPIVFLDTETTGLHSDRRPWEIAMIRREDGVPDRALTLQVQDVDLSAAELIGLNIGRFHERHNRFSTAWHDESDFVAVDEAKAATYVEQWTRGAHIVGLVPNFDTECLAAMLRRHKLCPAWHYHLIDVETMAAGWIHAAVKDGYDFEAPQLPWRSDEISRLCGIEPPSDDERHTAMGDAHWAQRWFDHITGSGISETRP